LTKLRAGLFTVIGWGVFQINLKNWFIRLLRIILQPVLFQSREQLLLTAGLLTEVLRLFLQKWAIKFTALKWTSWYLKI